MLMQVGHAYGTTPVCIWFGLGKCSRLLVYSDWHPHFPLSARTGAEQSNLPLLHNHGVEKPSRSHFACPRVGAIDINPSSPLSPQSPSPTLPPCLSSR